MDLTNENSIIDELISLIDDILEDETAFREDYSNNTYNFLRKYGHL